ncbi:MAG TPA: hypothetical protein VJS37_17420 [Terriglobales bacterium]|nr:hypothetical protein [Terriglobales bacterium]
MPWLWAAVHTREAATMICPIGYTLGRMGGDSTMPRNILEVISAISEDKTFTPVHNLTQIGRIAKGFAPMLAEILEEYIRQNSGGPTYRVERIKAARRMLGA